MVSTNIRVANGIKLEIRVRELVLNGQRLLVDRVTLDGVQPVTGRVPNDELPSCHLLPWEERRSDLLLVIRLVLIFGVALELGLQCDRRPGGIDQCVVDIERGVKVSERCDAAPV